MQKEIAEADAELEDLLSFQKNNKNLTWIPDYLVTTCMSSFCSRNFNASTRKVWFRFRFLFFFHPQMSSFMQHHCRCCGRIFCKRCTKSTFPLPKLGYAKPVRVCDSCMTLLSGPKSPFSGAPSARSTITKSPSTASFDSD